MKVNSLKIAFMILFFSNICLAAKSDNSDLIKVQYFDYGNEKMIDESAIIAGVVHPRAVREVEVIFKEYLNKIPKLIDKMCSLTNGGSIKFWVGIDSKKNLVLMFTGLGAGIEFNVNCKK